MLRLGFNIWLVTAALLLSATASLALPNCIGSYKTSKWTNCSGTYVYTNGDVYVGGWKDGKFHGHGIILYATGIKSAGYYVDGKKNGQFSETFPDGFKYYGEYKDGLRNGYGTAISAGGDLSLIHISEPTRPY